MKTRTIIALFALVAVGIGLAGCFESSGPVAKIIASPTEAYPPFEAVLSAIDSSSAYALIASYQWDFGDGSELGNAQVEYHTYETKGVYEVTLTVTDSNGDTDVAATVITAKNIPPTARFELTPRQVAVNQSVRLNASSSVDLDGEIVSYIWDFGDGETDEGVSVRHAYTEHGWSPQITLTVIDEDGATSTFSDFVVVVTCCGG